MSDANETVAIKLSFGSPVTSTDALFKFANCRADCNSQYRFEYALRESIPGMAKRGACNEIIMCASGYSHASGRVGGPA